MTSETYIPDLSSFNGRISDARRTEGFSSPGALAKKADLPESTVRRWESGETKRPRKVQLAAAAKVLRHRVEWLLKGEGDRYVDGAEAPAGRLDDATAENGQPLTVDECKAHVDHAIDSVECALRALQYVKSQLRKR